MGVINSIIISVYINFTRIQVPLLRLFLSRPIWTGESEQILAERIIMGKFYKFLFALMISLLLPSDFPWLRNAEITFQMDCQK